MQKIIRRRPSIEIPESLQQNCPSILQAVYAQRGVLGEQELNRGLGAMLKPDTMKGLDEAVALLVDAVTEQRKILIVGDFDADGATSSALSMLALRAMGAHYVDYLVPNRFEYGYGLTPEIVEVAKGRSPDLIMTVDNGISSIEGVAFAKEAGIKVLVTDHHLPGAETPSADAIVNPNQRGCEFPSKNLAGVGVVFYLMIALRAALRDAGWFSLQGIKEPNMGEFLDLVALGTVADVVALDHNNRILVHQGLQRMRAGQLRPGIRALLDIAGRQLHRLVASDMGFAVGPRLNAAGRLDDMSLGIECLLCDSDSLAREMAFELDSLNKDRRAIEGSMQQEAMADLKKLSLGEESQIPWGLCLYDGSWHQGVVGILASRIKDQYHRPVIAFADADNGEIKGSARSIAGLHIRDALDAVASANPGLLTKFGGHAMAAGLSLKQENFQAFQVAFDRVVREQLSEDDLQAVIFSDGGLSPQQINFDLACSLREAGPWGQHFPEPVFDGEFAIVQQRLVGEKHLKLVLQPLDDGKPAGEVVDAIAFNVDLELWPNPGATQLRAAYRLDINEFRGQQSLQLMVEYLEPVSRSR
ncbi:MAG: single-stranded-DNA-specific exonuclease RecJ [Candidatus Pelagadaptatus aseana]|uniref:single-stranded-DNA-specific exonuclease RecJ n=1 Tax=Candidatus Pelagadaptatus aseana TaxID=3120508 RepID=UPI0039B309FF